MASGDLAAIKQKAEAGDANAQVLLGDGLAANFRAVEALSWYRKAAQQGNIVAAHDAGQMLLFGAPGFPLEQQNLAPNPTEGIRWTFQAATNFHPGACLNVATALRRGLGVGTNLVEAYAWLQLAADLPPGSIVAKIELNKLALELDSDRVRRGQALAAQFKARNFVPLTAREIPEGDPRLKLSGITTGGKTSLAMINGKTLAENESAVVPVAPGTLRVKCLSIQRDCVLIRVEGEDDTRLLRLKSASGQ